MLFAEEACTASLMNTYGVMNRKAASWVFLLMRISWEEMMTTSALENHLCGIFIGTSLEKNSWLLLVS